MNVFQKSYSSEGAKGMRMRQITRCLRARSSSLPASIAFTDAYADLHTKGFCLPEVLIVTLLLKMNKGALDLAQMARFASQKDTHQVQPKVVPSPNAHSHPPYMIKRTAPGFIHVHPLHRQCFQGAVYFEQEMGSIYMFWVITQYFTIKFASSCVMKNIHKYRLISTNIH